MNQFIHESSRLGENVKLGRNINIMENVTIGDNCQIGHNVVIHQDTIIGTGVRIDDNTVIGKLPMKAAASATTREITLPATKIGENCMIGACVVIYRGCIIGRKVLVADQASLREEVSVGEFTIVGRCVAIENRCTVGKRCKLETNSYITAISEIGDYCFIAPGVVFTNDNYMGRDKERYKHFKGVTIKRGGRVGGNVTVLPGIVIEEDGQVAAGATVTRDVPTKKIVVGIPGKVFRDVPEAQLLENQEGVDLS